MTTITNKFLRFRVPVGTAFHGAITPKAAPRMVSLKMEKIESSWFQSTTFKNKFSKAYKDAMKQTDGLEALSNTILSRVGPINILYYTTSRGDTEIEVRSIRTTEPISHLKNSDLEGPTPILSKGKLILILDMALMESYQNILLERPSIDNVVILTSQLDVQQLMSPVTARKLLAKVSHHFSAEEVDYSSMKEGDSWALFDDTVFLQSAPSADILSEMEQEVVALVKSSEFYSSLAPTILVTHNTKASRAAALLGIVSVTVEKLLDILQDKEKIYLPPLKNTVRRKPKPLGICAKTNQTNFKIFKSVYHPHLRELIALKLVKATEERLSGGKSPQYGDCFIAKLEMLHFTCLRGIATPIGCYALTVGNLNIHGQIPINRACHEDTVLIQLCPMNDIKSNTEVACNIRLENPDDRIIQPVISELDSTSIQPATHARVLAVLDRAQPSAGYVGQLQHRQGYPGLRFVPHDPRVPYMKVRAEASLSGTLAVVRMQQWDASSYWPDASILELLGNVGDTNAETDGLLRQYRFSDADFSSAVYQSLPPADWIPSLKDIEGRCDFRDCLVASIDPPGCQDIDDALSFKKIDDSTYQFGIHIADVTHFVSPDSELDREAATRCTTVYLVDRRVDMLPKLLTTDLCSLRPHVDRLTFSAVFETDLNLNIKSVNFTKGIINSSAKLTYEQAQNIIDDNNNSTELATALRHMLNLSRKLHQRRVAQGSVELNSEEVRFVLDDQGDPVQMAKYPTFETNNMIAEFMLLANEAVAGELVASFPRIALLRQHSPPVAPILETLLKTLEKVGVHNFDSSSNFHLSKSLGSIEDTEVRTLVRTMVTRTLSPAKYIAAFSVEPSGYAHYGIGLEKYTHFTSPIRRYADILVHRLLFASLTSQPPPDQFNEPRLMAQCERMNNRNMAAKRCAMACDDMYKYRFLYRAAAKGPLLLTGTVAYVSPTQISLALETFTVSLPVALRPRDKFLVNSNEVTVQDPAYFINEASDAGNPSEPLLSYDEPVTFMPFDRIVVLVKQNDRYGRAGVDISFVGVCARASVKLGLYQLSGEKSSK